MITGLPRWPAKARELLEAGPPADRQLDGWLVAAGAVYLVVGFGLLLVGGRWMGLAAFGPEVVLLPPLVLLALVVGVKLQGGRLRWASVAAFAAWVALMALGHLWVWSEAVASV